MDEAVAELSVDDHRRGFAAVASSLLAEFDRYLDDDPDPELDQASYRQFSLWLSDTERAELIEEFRESIRKRATLGPSGERNRHLLATIMFPAGPKR